MKTKILILLFTSMIISACGPFKGTNTGNPGFTGSHPVDGSVAVAQQLQDNICATLKRCFNSATQSLCLSEMAVHPEATKELHIDNTFLTLEELIHGERNRLVEVNQLQAESCLAAMNDSSCESAEIQLSYSDNDPNNFINAPHILRLNLSCSQIYSMPNK